MTGKGKFGLLIVLALLMAGVSIVLVHVMVKREKNKAAEVARRIALEEFEKQKGSADLDKQGFADVLVAGGDIQPASIIFPEMVQTKSFPKSVIPPGAFAKFEDLGERMSVHFIPAGDMLLPSKVKPKQEITRPSFLVEKGKRYLTLPLEPAVQGVAAMIRIGDEIDILATYGDSPQTAVSKIIVQKAKVIDVAYGDSKTATAQDTGSGKAPTEASAKRMGIGDTVTFEVNPEDAEMLKALEASGISYKYLLRNYQDDAVVQTGGKRTADVINGLFGIQGVQTPEEAPPAPNVF